MAGTWQRVDSDVFTDSSIAAVAVVDGRIVVAGIRYAPDGAGDSVPTAWISEDGGLSWSASTMPVPDGWNGNAHDLTSTTAGGLVAVGTITDADDFTIQRAVAWSSTDGSTWSHVQIGGNAVASAVVSVGRGVVATGNDSTGAAIALDNRRPVTWAGSTTIVGGLRIVASDGIGSVVIVGGEGDTPVWRGITAEK